MPLKSPLLYTHEYANSNILSGCRQNYSFYFAENGHNSNILHKMVYTDIWLANSINKIFNRLSFASYMYTICISPKVDEMPTGNQ